MSAARSAAAEAARHADPHGEPARPEVAHVAESFVELMRTFSRARAQFLAAAAHDVEWSAQVVLRCVAMEGPMRSGAIADMCSADPSTISRHVAALVKDGLLERRADPDDGRATLLATTPKAEGVLQAQLEVRNAHFARMLAGWSDRDLKQLATLMNRFTEDYRTAKHNLLPPSAAETQQVTAEGND